MDQKKQDRIDYIVFVLEQNIGRQIWYSYIVRNFATGDAVPARHCFGLIGKDDRFFGGALLVEDLYDDEKLKILLIDMLSCSKGKI